MSADPSRPERRDGRRAANAAREVIERVPSARALQRRQAAVARDLIRLDVTPPRFESEGLALIRELLAED